MILSPFGRLASFFELSTVLRSLSALRALGFAALCKAQLPNPLRVLSKTQPRLKLWDMGVWAMGYGIWVGVCNAFLVENTLRFITTGYFVTQNTLRYTRYKNNQK